jgi:hypothetical protein
VILTTTWQLQKYINEQYKSDMEKSKFEKLYNVEVIEQYQCLVLSKSG